MKSLRIIVRGKVQGVYFRHYTLQRALAEDIRGAVSNDPDGSVVIDAEGSEAAMVRFLEFCRRGSPQAQVESVSVEEMAIRGLEEFHIVR